MTRNSRLCLNVQTLEAAIPNQLFSTPNCVFFHPLNTQDLNGSSISLFFKKKHQVKSKFEQNLIVGFQSFVAFVWLFWLYSHKNLCFMIVEMKQSNLNAVLTSPAYANRLALTCQTIL